MTEQFTGNRPPLQRPTEGRLIGGVCAGLATTLGVDVVVVRIIVAVIALLGGAGVAAYVVAWILIPDESGRSVLTDAQKYDKRGQQWLIIAAGAIAVIILLNIDWRPANAIALIAVGILVVALVQRGSANTSADPSVLTAERIHQTRTPSPSSRLTPAIVSLLAIALGVMMWLEISDTSKIGGRSMVAILLIISGLGLLISSFIGHARGLIAIGIILSLLLIPAGIDTPASVGDRTWIPTSSTDVGPYRLGMGTATLDLRNIAMAENTRVSLDSRVSIGQLIVLLPASDVDGTISAHVGVGSISVFGARDVSGLNQTQNITFGPGKSSPQLILELSVSVGEIEVRRG